MHSSRVVSRLAATLGLWLVGLPALGSTGATMALAEASGPAGVRCPRAEGVYIALLVPGTGSLLLATKPFPGGQPVGSVDARRLRGSVAGVGEFDLETTSVHSGSRTVWGMVDRSLEIGRRTGCFSFGDREFSSVDDLKTYLHWMLRDLFFRLRSAQDPEPLALRLGDRNITLEVSVVGHQAARLRTREGGTVGLQLPDVSGVYYFQPFVLDETAGRLAVKVLRKEQPFFGEGKADEVAFVTCGREAPGVTATEPVLEIRTAAID